MSWPSNLPKGCPGIPYRPASNYGNTWSDVPRKVSTKHLSSEIWLYYKTNPLPSGVTGKDITLDVVVKGISVGYFNLVPTGIAISFKFYSILTGWSDTWHEYGRWQILRFPNGGGYNTTSIGEALWNSPGSFGGSNVPAWGKIRTPKYDAEYGTSDIASLRYAEFKSKADALYEKEQSYAGSSGASYAKPLPFGVRYLSNGCEAQPGRNYPSPKGIIYKDGQVDVRLSFDKFDMGGNRNGLKHINLSADWIRDHHGTAVGVTKFEMRITLVWEYSATSQKDIGIWTFGGDHNMEGPFTKIDNPLIGLLDYSGDANHTADNRHKPDWPNRFDGQAWYRNKKGTPVKLQAQYKPKGGSWNIF